MGVNRVFEIQIIVVRALRKPAIDGATGSAEQTFGVNQQDQRVRLLQKAEHELARSRAVNIFLGLLTGLAALLAITYEIFRRRRKPIAIPMKVMLLAASVPTAAQRVSKRPSNSVGFARAPRTSRRRTKQAASVNISKSSGRAARFTTALTRATARRGRSGRPAQLAATNKHLA